METTAAGEAVAGDIATVPVRRAGLGSTVMTLGVFERATVVLVAAFAIGNAVWIARYRHGQPLDIDEAGYLLLALHDFHGYAANGVAGWLGAVELVSPHGPLVPAVTSVLFAVVGPARDAGFVASILFGAAAVIAAYHLGTLVSGRAGVGFFVAVCVATVPSLTGEVRSYHFAVAATAMATLALVALLRSRRLTLLPWSIAFGVCAALMVLSRTMTMAFLPALAVPAALYAIGSDDRRTALRNLLLAGAAGLFTASTWNVDAWKAAAAYLGAFGYGASSYAYGNTESTFSLNAWSAFVHRTASEVHLPYALLVAAGILALLAASVVSVVRNGAGQSLRGIVRSPAAGVALFVVLGVVALRSSRNEGVAFAAPLLPAAFALSALGLRRLLPSAFRVVAGLVVVGMLAWSAATFDLTGPAARPVSATLPIWGFAVVSDGRAPIEQYEAAAGYRSGNPALPLDLVDGADWVVANRAVGRAVSAPAAGGKAVAFGFRHYLLNPNTVDAEYALQRGDTVPFVQVGSVANADATASYRDWLARGDGAGSCLLLTASGVAGEIQPPVDADSMERAAAQSGFVRGSRIELPDGRELRIWRRPSRCGSA